MALTITSGHTFSNGETMTTTNLNLLGTPTLTAPANTLVGATTTGSVTTITCTLAGRALLDDASAADQRTTLELGTAATSSASAFEASGSVSTHASATTGVHGISSFGATLIDDASASAACTTLGLGTSDAVTFASVADAAGGVRSIPQNAKATSYTLIASDAGKHISITTGGVTVPSGVFSTGDAISIYNNSGSSQTITQGTSTTVRQAGTASTGNRTLAQYGLITILCVASNTFVVVGAGIS